MVLPGDRWHLLAQSLVQKTATRIWAEEGRPSVKSWVTREACGLFGVGSDRGYEGSREGTGHVPVAVLCCVSGSENVLIHIATCDEVCANVNVGLRQRCVSVGVRIPCWATLSHGWVSHCVCFCLFVGQRMGQRSTKDLRWNHSELTSLVDPQTES